METTRMTELRRIRRAQDLTQAQLAEKAGVSLRLVNDAERGDHMPRAENLMKLADALGVALEDILPKGHVPESRSGYVNERGGVSQFRASRSHVAPIRSSSSVTVTVNREALRDVLYDVEIGVMNAAEAEHRLLAGVS